MTEVTPLTRVTGTVSYTHLDVYKRQSIISGTFPVKITEAITSGNEYHNSLFEVR